MIDEKHLIGKVILCIVTTEGSPYEIVSFMQSENYCITPVDATGYRGNIKMIQSFVNRVDAPQITAHFQSTNPHAIFSIEDVQYENEGVFRQKKAQCFHWYVSFVHTTPEEKITSE